MKKTYVIGDKIQRMRRIINVLYAVLVFVFYFVYDYVFTASGLITSKIGILILTVVMAVAVYIVISRMIMNYQKMIYYTIDDEGLLCVSGSDHIYYQWSDFKKAQFDYAALFSVGSVRFFMKDGKAFNINRYIDGTMQLTYEVLLKIKDTAVLEDDVLNSVEKMRKLR